MTQHDRSIPVPAPPRVRELLTPPIAWRRAPKRGPALTGLASRGVQTSGLYCGGCQRPRHVLTLPRLLLPLATAARLRLLLINEQCSSPIYTAALHGVL